MVRSTDTHTPADVARLLRQREEQGFPRFVTDPEALARVAEILRERAKTEAVSPRPRQRRKVA